MDKPLLSVPTLIAEATSFATRESNHSEPSLYGITDGKAVGTYLEHKFIEVLSENFSHERGSSAKGIDLPDLNVDIKVTSERQPQSSCPFRSARQKIFGLGYSLLVFVYRKTDHDATRSSTLDIKNTIFIEAPATGDYTMTKHLVEMVRDGANEEDIVGYMSDCNLPVDEIETANIAKEILDNPPKQGYLTISNALQWRLQYGHAIRIAGQVAEIHRLR